MKVTLGSKRKRANQVNKDPGLIPARKSLDHVDYINGGFFFFSNPQYFSQMGGGEGGERWDGPRELFRGNLVVV